MELVGSKKWKPAKIAELNRDLSWEPALRRLLTREVPKATEVLLLAFIAVAALLITFTRV